MGGSQTLACRTKYGINLTQPYSGCLSGSVLSYSLINLADQLILSGKRHAGVVVRYVPSFLARESASWCTDYTSAVLAGDMKYLLVPDRAPQFYNVADDPQEQRDLYFSRHQDADSLAKKVRGTEAPLFPTSSRISMPSSVLGM